VVVSSQLKQQVLNLANINARIYPRQCLTQKKILKYILSSKQKMEKGKFLHKVQLIEKKESR
jgi:hypothetical protein